MFELLSSAFHEVLYRPLFNSLVLLYDIIPGHDLGVAIIILTFLVRFALYSSSKKAIKSQKELQELQPKLKEIQDKYKDNKEKQAQALMEFYRKNKVNPLSGCLPLLVQMPILIALYHVFIAGFDDSTLNVLYSFVHNPGHINSISFGIIDLSQKNVILALVAGGLQFVQAKMMMTSKKKAKEKDNNKKKKDKELSKEEKIQDFSQAMGKQMVYFMPFITIMFAMSLPSGLALYWITTNLFAIGQQYLIFKKKNV